VSHSPGRRIPRANLTPPLPRQTFAKADLPKEHRVLKPDSMSTMDYKPERLNVHVDDEGTVNKVTHG